MLHILRSYRFEAEATFKEGYHDNIKITVVKSRHEKEKLKEIFSMLLMLDV